MSHALVGRPSVSSWKPPQRSPDSAFQDTDDARAFLQGRIARFLRAAFVIDFVFYPIGLVSRGVFGVTGRTGLASAFGPSSTAHLASIVVFLCGWLATRKRLRSMRFLQATDLIATVGGAAGFEMMSHGVEPWTRPDVFTPFLVSLLLVLRAAFVPSTARWSALVGFLASLPVPFLTYFFYLKSPLLGAPPAIALASNSTISCSLVVVVSAVVSHTVHGLRERVREATRLGQYTLSEKIGEGGMGIVYKASHALLRRATAIKLLPPDRAGEHNLTRFEREVQLTSQLTHPNTISVYDFGRTPEGIFYYAMEYLDGVDLQTLVDVDGPQEPGRVIHVLAQVAASLAEAHAIGLIHRDVKPANVMLCERGGAPDVVKVLDFGLVKELAASAEPSVGDSAMNHIIGTPLYLSPEAIVSPSNMDARSDLYAVGAVGYLLLTGTPPFTGNSVVEVCGHHLHSPVVPPSERLGRTVPADLERLILACLAKSPDDRPRDATAFQEALLACESAGSFSRERAALWWRDQYPLVERRRQRAEHPPEARFLHVTRHVAG